jgi:hypothetical protein
MQSFSLPPKRNNTVSQQQESISSSEQEHPHSGSLPLLMEPMTAAAQPTPLPARIASNAQFKAQAPHSIHRSLSVMRASPPSMRSTPRGHTSTHRPHPVHSAESICRETTFLRYFKGHPIPSICKALRERPKHQYKYSRWEAQLQPLSLPRRGW